MGLNPGYLLKSFLLYAQISHQLYIWTHWIECYFNFTRNAEKSDYFTKESPLHCAEFTYRMCRSCVRRSPINYPLNWCRGIRIGCFTFKVETIIDFGFLGSLDSHFVWCNWKKRMVFCYQNCSDLLIMRKNCSSEPKKTFGIWGWSSEQCLVTE